MSPRPDHVCNESHREASSLVSISGPDPAKREKIVRRPSKLPTVHGAQGKAGNKSKER